jgi:hypothetical protein
VPSVQIGEALVREFANGFGALGDRYIDAIERGAVSLGELDAFILMTPSGIPQDSGERQIYQNLLFAEAGLERPEDFDRRKSLLLILNLARQLGHAPDTMDVRWALYAGCLPDEFSGQSCAGGVRKDGGGADRRARDPPPSVDRSP